jgi:hypothetical protein
MTRPIYQIDEIAKAILLGLEESGKKKTFAQLLDEANVPYDKDKEVEVANTLEALCLIESVSYRLPLEIRGELTEAGRNIVASLKKSKSTRSLPRSDHLFGQQGQHGYPSIL